MGSVNTVALNQSSGIPFIPTSSPQGSSDRVAPIHISRNGASVRCIHNDRATATSGGHRGYRLPGCISSAPFPPYRGCCRACLRAPVDALPDRRGYQRLGQTYQRLRSVSHLPSCDRHQVGPTIGSCPKAPRHCVSRPILSPSSQDALPSHSDMRRCGYTPTGLQVPPSPSFWHQDSDGTLGISLRKCARILSYRSSFLIAWTKLRKNLGITQEMLNFVPNNRL